MPNNRKKGTNTGKPHNELPSPLSVTCVGTGGASAGGEGGGSVTIVGVIIGEVADKITSIVEVGTTSVKAGG